MHARAHAHRSGRKYFCEGNRADQKPTGCNGTARFMQALCAPPITHGRPDTVVVTNAKLIVLPPNPLRIYRRPRVVFLFSRR